MPRPAKGDGPVRTPAPTKGRDSDEGMRKEYDSSMTFNEVVFRLRDKTVPYSVNPFKALLGVGEWALRENFDGTYSIEKSVQGRALFTYATLKIQPLGQGTHLILETSGMGIPGLFCLIWLIVSPILAYWSVRNGASVGYTIFIILFAFVFSLLCTLGGWYKEKDLIDFFESDILGIKK